MTVKSIVISGISAFLLAGAVPVPCHATASVGDEIKVSFKTVDGGTVNIEQLKGKLVVLDFWATWCGPCMQAMPEMIQMHDKYSTKGLVMIGISLDSDKAKMLQVTKQQGMSWPEYFDGQGWGNKLFKQYGGSSIPFTMLISTQGKVLFAGHPSSGLDRAVEEAFQKDPPHLVDPKVLAAAKEELDGVEKKVDAGDARGAIKLLSRVPIAAKLDPEFAARQDDVQKKLVSSADSMLADVQKQITAGNYQEAASRLKELSDGLSGLPEATKAKKMLTELMAKPAARAAIAQAEKDAKANQELEVAVRLQGEKKDEQAYGRFKAIAKEFTGTEAGNKAAAEVRKYEANPGFVQRANEHAAAGKATSALRLAESYKRAGRDDLARKKYQSVIDQFPGTSYAAAAQKAMSELQAN